MENPNLNLNILRQENLPYNSPWLFPIRMEGRDYIEWQPNIVCALGQFRRNIDEMGWRKLLVTGKIAAESGEQAMLERWWREGWKETPQLPAKRSVGNPILRTKYTGLGEDLEIIYPSVVAAAKALHCDDYLITRLCAQDPKAKCPFNGRLLSLRAITDLDYAAQQDNKLPWTLFDANNMIVGHYANRFEIADYLGLPWREIDIAHRDRYNYVGGGYWVWYEKWGLMPISPDDEPLGKSWRTKCAPKPTVETKVD